VPDAPDFRLLFESAPELSLVLTPELMIVAATDAYLSATRKRRDHMVGRNLLDVFRDESVDPAASGVANLLKASLARVIEQLRPDTMAVQKYDMHGREPDGAGFELRHVRPVNTPVLNARGQLAYVIHRVEDVSELVRLTERLDTRARELDENTRELDGFTYSVSHDLRAPLRAIDGFAKILTDEYGPQLGEEGARLTTIIRRNALKMGRLIDDLLVFSRIARQPIQIQRVDMAALARQVGEEVGEGARSIELRIGALPVAEGDHALLRLVWTHLLGNAVKYTRPRPQAVIEVGGRAADGELVFTVEDNGVGFDARYADKLFGVFQRLHNNADFEGTGIGLALVQRIVRRHGGWVKGECTRGEGAVFSFGIPIRETDWRA